MKQVTTILTSIALISLFLIVSYQHFFLGKEPSTYDIVVFLLLCVGYLEDRLDKKK